MTIEEVVQRYHDRSRFYAWDVHEMLRRRFKATYAALTYLATMKQPVTLSDLIPHLVLGRRGGTDQTMYQNVYNTMQRLRHLELIMQVEPRRSRGAGGGTYAPTWMLSTFGRHVMSWADVAPPAEAPGPRPTTAT